MSAIDNIPVLDLSHRAARKALAQGAPVFLPVNPVEYHGPHLPLHNDRLVCAGLIHDLHACLTADHGDWPLLQVDDLELGVDTVPGPGSRQTSYPVAVTQIQEACHALADLGVQQAILMTFHGSPLHNLALEAGIRTLTRRGVRAVAPMNAVFRRLMKGGPRSDPTLQVTHPALKEAMATGPSFDSHAGFLETSLTLHYAPDAVDPSYRDLPPCPAITPVRRVEAASRALQHLGRLELAAELAYAAQGLGWHALEPFPGYSGTPHLATAEVGAELARLAVGIMAPVTRDALAGRIRSPRPIMSWLAALTLGGRLGSRRRLTTNSQ